MSLFKRKGREYEKPFVKSEIESLVEKVKALDDDEFQMFMDAIGIEAEKADKPAETPAEEKAKIDDVAADADVQTAAAKVVDDVNADKQADAAGAQPDYQKTNVDESQLKAAIDNDQKADAAVQQAQGPGPESTELTDKAADPAQSESSNTPQEQQAEPPPAAPEQTAQAPAVSSIDSETVNALVARIDQLEQKLAILAEAKAQIPAYGGMSRQSVLADSDIGGTQDGKPRTIEEFRRRFAHLNIKP